MTPDWSPHGSCLLSGKCSAPPRPPTPGAASPLALLSVLLVSPSPPFIISGQDSESSRVCPEVLETHISTKSLRGPSPDSVDDSAPSLLLRLWLESPRTASPGETLPPYQAPHLHCLDPSISTMWVGCFSKSQEAHGNFCLWMVPGFEFLFLLHLGA